MASRSRPEARDAFAPRGAATGPRGGRGLRIAILVDQVAELEAAAGDPSALVHSTGNVQAAIRSLGHQPIMVEMQAGKPMEWVRRLVSEDFDLAFNLCESVAGRSAGEHLAAASVELLGIPLTGARSTTLLYCHNKDHCNARLRAHGFAVPDWRLVHALDGPPTDWGIYPAIVKPAAEDGSNGVHASSVVESAEDLAATVERLGKMWKRLLLQEFVVGREINLAVVGRYLLPPAEIDFGGLPPGSPPIVSYEAKWQSGSPEDLGTRPICPAPLPAAEVEELQLLAARAWRLLDGGGYGRVDVRLRANGEPAVIDVNPNPDLSPDAGLARQARAAGWSYEQLIDRIVEVALAPASDPSADDFIPLKARPAGRERYE